MNSIAQSFSNVVFTPLQNLVFGIFVELYGLVGNLGLVLIIFTVLLRALFVPLTWQSLKAQKQLRLIQPELAKLKKKHKNDKQGYQKAQLELMQRHNVNPLAGCLPQLVQIFFLILLYRILVSFLGQSEISGVTIDPHFLWLNLSLPDPFHIIPVLAGLAQLVLSFMIAPAAETPDLLPENSKDKAIQQANEKEEDMAEMAATMQKQMVFILPVMTTIFALNFPAGLGIYWLVTTLFTIGQQWVVSGPGGLVSYTQRTLAFISGKVTRK